MSEAGVAPFQDVHDEFLNSSTQSELAQINNTENSSTIVDTSTNDAEGKISDQTDPNLKAEFELKMNPTPEKGTQSIEMSNSSADKKHDSSKNDKIAISEGDNSTNGVLNTSGVSKIEDISPESVASTDTSTLVDEKPLTQNVASEMSSQNVSTPLSEQSPLTATSDDEADDIEEERASHLTSLPSKRRRIVEPDLPSTCTVLVSSKTGGKVYLVGTAHFSKESQDDVARVIRAVQPDAVVLELCKARINILHTDEAKVQEEAANLTFDKMLATVRQNGVVQGTMYLFLLYFSAKLTKELGMAPGGEFRRAFIEARNVPGCIIQLGDRPIEVTLKRAFTTLSLWQKLKFGYTILTYKDSITAEEVEQCKQKDLLASMLEEIAGEFPALSRVFVQERDLFLAHSLRIAVDSPVRFPADQSGASPVLASSDPPVVVGVVGIGHCSGIVANWDKVVPSEIGQLMTIPQTSMPERIAYTVIRVSVIGLSLYTMYKVVQLPVSFVKSRFL